MFQIALEHNELDKWRGDLDQIAESVKDPRVAAFLQSPKVHFSDKVKVVRQGFKGTNPLAMNLVLLLVSRGRLNIIGDVAYEYGRMVDEKQDIVHADVVTAMPLSADEETVLARRLGEILKRKIVLSASVSPDIIGGLVVKVGDKLIDGSTKSQFSALRKSMGGSVK